MRDTLDLSELRQRGDAFRRQARVRSRRTLALLAITVALVVVQRLTVGHQLGTLYTINGNKISAQDNPIDPGPYRVYTSSDGALWVEASSCSHLYRYLDGTWTQFTKDDIGPKEGCVETLAVNGSDAWAVSGSDVSHFDGAKWTVYPNAVGQYTGSIVASQRGAAAIDYYGNFSHFDGTVWFTQSVVSMLPFFSAGSAVASYYPTMQVAPNGDFILAYFGLWRFDGENWKKVAPFSDEMALSAHLLAVDGDTAWLSTLDGLASVSLSSGQAHQFDARAIGLSSDEQIEAAAAHNGAVYANSASALYRFDGNSWTRLSGLDLGGNVLGNVAIDANGTVWAAAYPPQINDSSFGTFYSLTNVLAIAGAPFVLILIIYFFWLYPSARANVATVADTRDVLRGLLPDLPTYTSSASRASASRARFWFYVLVIGGTTLWLGSANASFAESIIVLVMVTLALIIVPRIFQLQRASSQQERDVLKSATILVSVYIVLLLGCVAIVGLILTAVINKVVADAALASMLNITLSLLIGFTMVRYILSSPILLVYHGPLARGDYGGALRRVDRYLRYLPRYSSFMMLRAFVLSVAGHFDDAVTAWTDALAAVQNSGALFVAGSLANLGHALAGLGHNDEGLRMIEAAVKLRPYNSIEYALLIGIYNKLEIEAERALDISEVMMHFAVKPRYSIYLGTFDWSQILGERALVLARVGRFDEADAIMRQAFNETNKDFVPGRAMLHVTAGRLAALKGDLAKAREEYDLALKLDPKGAAGRSAASAVQAT